MWIIIITDIIHPLINGKCVPREMNAAAAARYTILYWIWIWIVWMNEYGWIWIAVCLLVQSVSIRFHRICAFLCYVFLAYIPPPKFVDDGKHPVHPEKKVENLSCGVLFLETDIILIWDRERANPASQKAFLLHIINQSENWDLWRK